MENYITQAGLLFNAANIPCSFFMRLCEEHDPQEIYEGESFLRELGLSDAQVLRLAGLIAKDDWHVKELDKLDKLGARFITAKDIDYPARLFDLKRPPVGIYVKGRANLSMPSVAIVGTRKPGTYGKDTASQLAGALARGGAMTISGGAQGIDSAAHRGSLSEGGLTVAVFGTSIDKVYPSQNRDLFSRIVEQGGAVISEYAIGCPGESWHFPERNRIIAAIASRVVIAEAGEKSGAMITARYAVELGRDLWAVPGRICDETFGGTNRLISRGAKCLYDIGEFAESFTGRHEQLNLFGNEENNGKEDIKSAPVLSDEEKVIFSLIQKRGSRLLDELVNDSGFDAQEVMSALMMLEAEGLIREVSGRYSAVN